MIDYEALNDDSRHALFMNWLERAKGKDIIFHEESGAAAGEWPEGAFWQLCQSPKDVRAAIAKAQAFTDCSFREIDSDTWDRFDQWLTSQDLAA